MGKFGNKARLIIYGGSFNPVHIGHLRLALEALRLLGNARLEFVPVARPPHKNSECLLPFDLRLELLRRCIDGIAGLACSAIEETLPGPSYSVRTIQAVARAHPDEEICFLMGSSDYMLLPEWHNGLDLPELCDLAVAPRGNMNFEDFVAMSEKLWPGQVRLPRETGSGHGGGLSWLRARGKYRIFFLPAPWLNISATYIRSLWLCGGNIDFLLPGAALELLNKERQAVDACWRRCD